MFKLQLLSSRLKEYTEFAFTTSAGNEFQGSQMRQPKFFFSLQLSYGLQLIFWNVLETVWLRVEGQSVLVD